MVAVEHQHGGFVKVLKFVDERADEGVHLGKLVDVIGQRRRVHRFRRGEHLDIAFDFLRLRGILAVGLHGDGKDEIAPRRGGQRLHRLAHEHAVARPAEGVVGQAVHVFLRHEAVKAQLGVNGVAAIERARIVVHGGGGVAQFLQIEADRFAGGVLENGIVGKLAGGEVIQVHAGEHLKFRIGRAAAHGGHLELAVGAGFHQFAEHGNGLLGKLRAHEVVDVEERFQLHKDHVGRQRLRLSRLRRRGGLDDVAGDLLDQFLGILDGPLDAEIGEGIGKAIGEAVVLVGVDQAGLFPVDIAQFHGNLAHHQRQRRHRAEHADADRAVDILPLAALDHDEHEAGDEQRRAHEHAGDLIPLEIDGDHLQPVGNEQHVARGERQNARHLHDGIDRPQHHPEDAQHPARAAAAAKEFGKEEGVEDDLHVEQEHPRMSRQKQYELFRRMVVEKFDDERQNQRDGQHVPRLAEKPFERLCARESHRLSPRANVPRPARLRGRTARSAPRFRRPRRRGRAFRARHSPRRRARRASSTRWRTGSCRRPARGW